MTTISSRRPWLAWGVTALVPGTVARIGNAGAGRSP